MQSIFRRLRQIQLALSRRHESLLLQGVGPLDAYKPLYEWKPSWAARWTYPIIFAQIGVSCALTELIVHHWTEPKAPADDLEENASDAGPNEDSASKEPVQTEYVLRPLWQRASAAFGQFCLGAFVCVLLLNSRSRIIRRLYLLPSSAVAPTALSPKLPKVNQSDRFLVAQNVYHFRGQGNVFPFSRTSLTEGYDQNELGFTVIGVPGKYYLGLHGAKVNGVQESSWQTKEALFRLWYGPRAKKEMSRFGWVA